MKNKFFSLFGKNKKLDLNLEYRDSVAIKHEGTKIIFYKAIDQKGRFVWISKSEFPDDERKSFYLTILRDLNFGTTGWDLISKSFNLFYNRQDFYSRYTFVKNVKKHEE